MIKQILWDWNGTLLDDLHYGMEVRNRVFPHFHLPTINSIEEYHAQFTFPIRLYYERAGVTDDIFVPVAHAWMDEYVRGFATVPLHEDARQTIRRFAQAGLAQAVLSASKLDLLREQIAQFGIQDSFAAILGLGDIYAGSKEEIGRSYLQGCGFAPGETCMIGDTLHDAEVAAAIGAKCILVARGHQSRETLLTAGVPVADSLQAAADWILNPVVWGFDIGGTKCALCAADEAGRILCRHEIKTAEFDSWQKLMQTLVDWGLANAPRPLAAGVSCGGPLDAQRGLILSPPNLPGWDEVPITAWLNEKLGVPAFLQNDANACALAEWQYGAGRGAQNMVFLTFGTGFGAGLILNGRLYEGTNGMAGEIGHVRLEHDGPVGYGKAGSAEGFCSGGGLNQLSRMMLGKNLSARDLAGLADAGDEDAKRVLTLSAQMLGRALSILIDLFNPDCIVIGSIFARAESSYNPQNSPMARIFTFASFSLNNLPYSGFVIMAAN